MICGRVVTRHYLYPASIFAPLELPESARRALAVASS